VVSPRVEFYGNFKTAGVILDLTDLPRSELPARLSCDLNTGGTWSEMHDPAEIGSSRCFATSLFWLRPASAYQVRIRCYDDAGKLLFVCHGAGTTRADLSSVPLRRVLYVATTGADSDTGSETRPFQTISRALQAARPSDTILIRQGVYSEGQLEFAESGAADAPITLKNAPGETVILDGTDIHLRELSAWGSPESGIYRQPFSMRTQHGCVVDSATGRTIRLFPVKTVQELLTRTTPGVGEPVRNVPFGELGIEGALCSDGKTLSLGLPANLGHCNVHISGQDRAISLVGRQHIRIDGLEFRHFGLGEDTTAVFVRNSSDIQIVNCRFHCCNSYIYVKGQSDRITIQDCTFHDALLSWPFDLMKQEGGISGYFEGGSLNVDASYSGRGLVFRRNRIEGLFDGAHLTPYRENNARTNEIDFYQNVVDGCVDDFLEADGYSRNVRIFDNRMTRSLSGVSLAQALDGPTFVIYNVLAECGSVPAAQRGEHYGYPFKTNGVPGSDTGSGPIFLYHNTAFTSDPNSRAMLVKRARWKQLRLRNNIWCGQAAGFELWPQEPSPLDWDYDNLYVAKKQEPLLVQAYRRKFPTIKSITMKFGWQTHGLSKDPQFRHAAAGKFELRDESPCIDAGVLLPGINSLRIQGAAADIGAVER
jgi:hypothetical protein